MFLTQWRTACFINGVGMSKKDNNYKLLKELKRKESPTFIYEALTKGMFGINDSNRDIEDDNICVLIGVSLKEDFFSEDRTIQEKFEFLKMFSKIEESYLKMQELRKITIDAESDDIIKTIGANQVLFNENEV